MFLGLKNNATAGYKGCGENRTFERYNTIQYNIYLPYTEHLQHKMENE